MHTSRRRRTPNRRLAPALLVLTIALSSAARVALGQSPDHVFPDGTEVHLLSDDAARAAIADDSAEPYFSTLTLLEIAIKRGKPLETADVERERAAFREFVQSCVLPWSADEKRTIIEAVRSAHERMTTSVPSLIPKTWRFIKTDGRDDLGPHTRGSCIILHSGYLAAPPAMVEHLVMHEAMHVFSRAHPRKRERLYEALGFRRLDCLDVPPALDRRRITNPDCTDAGYAIRIRNTEAAPIDAVLMTFSKHSELQPDLASPLAYVTFALFEVRQADECWRVVTTEADDLGALPPHRAGGFFEQVGWNTQYVIHPEEIIAENLTMLVRSRSGDPSTAVVTPVVLDRIAAVLDEP